MGFLWRINPGTPLERPPRRDAFLLLLVSYMPLAHLQPIYAAKDATVPLARR